MIQDHFKECKSDSKERFRFSFITWSFNFFYGQYRFMEDNHNEPANTRYYPSIVEIRILPDGMIKYFQMPERSKERNDIAKEVSKTLSKINSHCRR